MSAIVANEPDDSADPALRIDHRVIVDMVESGSKVLDLGCGEGELLAALVREKQIVGQGVEIDDAAIYECVEKGLDVVHGDIDEDLAEYADDSFDYVIFDQSIQQVRHFKTVFDDAIRVGRKVIVGIPNFGHWRARIQMLRGRVPVTSSLPYSWYNSPNYHFVSISDFIDFCRDEGLQIERFEALSPTTKVRTWPNLLADVGVFLLTRARA